LLPFWRRQNQRKTLNRIEKVRILFVCLGNICRSPTAEVVFKEVDSAGTAAYHIGQAPDPRTRAAALRRGYDLSPLRARVVEELDFEQFDLILAMDHENLSALKHRAPHGADDRVRLFLEFSPELGTTEVPDPYYGGANGFEEVLDLVEAASRGLLRHVRERMGPGTASS
jgi:protein-tyrosine phosphatase